jgi:autotransporter translocation and assembly factor TamB
LRLTGAARTIPGGGFGFTDLIARGAHGSARLSGDFSRDKANLDAQIDVPQASVLDPRVSGHAQIVAALTGTSGDPGATLKATLGEGRLLDSKTTSLALDATVSHITGLLEAKADLSGNVDGHALQGAVHAAKTADGGWAADNIALSLASVRLGGALTVGADELVAGELSFGAANLDDLSPLALTKISGALQAKVNASAAEGKQAVAVTASSDRLAFGANQAEGVKVDLKIGDLWGARAISGVARIGRAEVAGQSISDVKLTAADAGESSDLDLSGTARGLAVNAHGSLTGGSPIRFDLALHRAGRRPHDRPRGACDADLRQGWACDPELRPARRFGPPRALGPSGREPRPPHDRHRAAANRARSRLARPRRLWNPRRRCDDPGNPPPISLATGAFAFGRRVSRKRGPTACRRSTSPARVGWRAAGPRSTSPPTQAIARPFA